MTSKRFSSFITGLAWTFIVLASFFTLVLLFQNIMIWTIFPWQEMEQALNSPESGDMPFFLRLVVSHFPLLFGFLFLISAFALAASLALLKRREWARKFFVLLMAVGITVNVFIFGFFLFIQPAHEPSAGPPDLPATENGSISWPGILTGSALFLAVVGLCGWIIGKLVSDEIRNEFRVFKDTGDTS